MKIYVAGSLRLKTIAEQFPGRVFPINRLDSFYYLRQHHLDDLQHLYSSFFLDSGAFSAWAKGEAIDLDQYIAFIKRNEARLAAYATLDVIGSVAKTEANTRYMEAAGLSPVPVFHYNEPWRVLEALIAEYPYIALGGMVPISTRDLEVWLPECFKRVCGADNMPKVKVHGFGLTTYALVNRFPWYSVDSTSCVMSSAMGRVLLPMGGDMDFGQTGIPSLIEKQYVEQRGYTVKQLTEDYIARQAFNIESTKMWEQALTDNPPVFQFLQQSLL